MTDRPSPEDDFNDLLEAAVAHRDEVKIVRARTAEAVHEYVDPYADLRARFSTLEGVPGFAALIDGDAPATVAWREAQRMRDGAVRVATRAQAIDDRIVEAAAQRAAAQASRARAAWPLVAGGAS